MDQIPNTERGATTEPATTGEPDQLPEDPKEPTLKLGLGNTPRDVVVDADIWNCNWFHNKLPNDLQHFFEEELDLVSIWRDEAIFIGLAKSLRKSETSLSIHCVTFTF